ncbi:hypothetical protein WDZ92_50325, partial [Nostoc sp. NIES-2111]
MEAIRETIMERNGLKISALQFEKVIPKTFVSMIDEMKDARALMAFYLDEQDCSNILFNPTSENDKIMVAAFIARCHTVYNHFLEIVGLA